MIRYFKNLTLCFALTTLTLYTSAQQNAYEKIADEARSLMSSKDHAEALERYQQSFTMGNDYNIDYYNAACCAALTQQTELANKLLIKSIQLGYLDKKWVQEDPDLEPLRSNKRWNSVLTEFDKQEKNLTKLFSKIKSVKYFELIPFQQNGNWGYVDKNTLKVVVQPVFKTLGFMSDCTEANYRDYTSIQIKSDGTISIKYPKHSNDSDESMIMDIRVEDEGPQPSYDTNFKGFKMNDQGEIIYFSSIYDRYQPAFFNISGPYKINGVYYAVAHKAGRSGVIDQEGNPLPLFDFVHHELVHNYSRPDGETWFYYKEESGKGGFVSEKGETRLAGELIGYPFYSSDVLDYNIQSDQKQWGILDKKNMTWVIRPQSLPIKAIGYSYQGNCQTLSAENAIELYFLIRDGDSAYYIDKNMKAYKPK
jgi:hypothetical protein